MTSFKKMQDLTTLEWSNSGILAGRAAEYNTNGEAAISSSHNMLELKKYAPLFAQPIIHL